MYKNERVSTLFTAQQIEARLVELAAEINHDYTGKEILLVGTLKGAYIFMADLSRKLTGPVEIDFMKASSYGDSTRPSELKFEKLSETKFTGKHVLLVEDIVDTGRTLAFLRDEVNNQNAASLRVCTLLDKPSRREVELAACEYIGFTIPDEFVVGYGLDYAQRYRNLPYVGILNFENEK